MALAGMRAVGFCGTDRAVLFMSCGGGVANVQNPLWTLDQVLLATGGRLASGGQTQAVFRRVCTDSRAVEAGDLFVALTGDRHDGHGFLAEVAQKRAAGLVVSRLPEETMEAAVIVVRDTLVALGDLAAYRRSLLPGLQVLAITGSSGKTTVKEMTAAILAGKHTVLKTQGNYNNLVGLPLSLLPVEVHHDFAVLEMGMNQPGEIARLTEIADPDIACITNVQDAHLAGLKDIAGVARAKGELFAGLKAWGKLVVNLDDKRVRGLARSCGQEKITFGRGARADVRATRLKTLGEQGMAFTLRIGGESARVRIRGLGVHNVQNALAAAGMAHAAGLEFKDIVDGLQSFRPSEKRLQVQNLPGGVRLINDAYNANPSSMLAALETVQQMDRLHRKVAVLGDMLELGAGSAEAHRKLGLAVARLGFDYLLAVGDFSRDMVEGARSAGMEKGRVLCFADKGAMAHWLQKSIQSGLLTQGDWILLKGSRGMRMETIVQELTEKQG